MPAGFTAAVRARRQESTTARRGHASRAPAPSLLRRLRSTTRLPGTRLTPDRSFSRFQLSYADAAKTTTEAFFGKWPVPVAGMVVRGVAVLARDLVAPGATCAWSRSSGRSRVRRAGAILRGPVSHRCVDSLAAALSGRVSTRTVLGVPSSNGR
jgi:hypothetical protein